MATNKKNVSDESAEVQSTVEQAEPITFTKEQLVASEKFANQKDLVSALLEDGKSYTISDTEKIISNQMKRKVN